MLVYDWNVYLILYSMKWKCHVDIVSRQCILIFILFGTSPNYDMLWQVFHFISKPMLNNFIVSYSSYRIFSGYYLLRKRISHGTLFISVEINNKLVSRAKAKVTFINVHLKLWKWWNKANHAGFESLSFCCKYWDSFQGPNSNDVIFHVPRKVLTQHDKKDKYQDKLSFGINVFIICLVIFLRY